jgi:flavin-dependent dehydrogenase
MTDAMTSEAADEREHDVVVVGARCAGAATAMLLARQGHDVLVVDRASFPSDTLSTHAIARGGIVQLARWDLLDRVVSTGAPPIRTASFHTGEARPITKRIKPQAGVDHLLAPRRDVLDALLIAAAVEAGAAVRTGVTVRAVTTGPDGRVAGVAARDEQGRSQVIRARTVVGADGVRSRIARAVGAATVDERPSDAATHYAYVAGLDAEGFEFHLGDRAMAGVFPTHHGLANVWICTPAASGQLAGRDRDGAFLDLLHRTSPSLAERVRRGEAASRVRSAVRLPNLVRQAAGQGWALVGDAGYHRDPVSGHGMTDAFRDAELLALHLGRALRAEVPEPQALAAYARDRDRALGPIFDLTCQMAAFPGRDPLGELQKQLGRLIDAEAAWLAGRPSLPVGRAVAA